MQRITGVIGVDKGSRILFNDLAHDGVMWTGSGSREIRVQQAFSGGFIKPPVVSVGISMWDIDHRRNSRIDIAVENITATAFEIVFRTWGDTNVARIRSDWIAIGQLRDEADWDVS